MTARGPMPEKGKRFFFEKRTAFLPCFSQMRELFCKILTDSVTEIFRYMARATDGDAGFLKKIVFDGDKWRVNTTVVELRGLPLIDPAQLKEAPHHARYDAMALRD